MVNHLLAASLSVLILFSCTAPQKRLFDQAVNDAAVVETSEICTDLIPIRPDNKSLVWHADQKRVLVVMWKSRDNFERFYKNQTHTAGSETYVTWVTAAPQVRRFARTYLDRHPDAADTALELRLKQYLGLAPQWHYDVFVELWVDPGDMFRPCVDPEITDTTCNLAFSEKVPQIKGIACYPCFYKDLYFQDFRTRPGIPWTGLGYTYDWGNPVSDKGASEFILVPGAAYEIHRLVETRDYIREDL